MTGNKRYTLLKNDDVRQVWHWRRMKFCWDIDGDYTAPEWNYSNLGSVRQRLRLLRLKFPNDDINVLSEDGAQRKRERVFAEETSGLKPCPRCHGTGNSPRKFIGYPHTRCELCSGFGRAGQQEVENYNKYGHAHL